MQHLCKIVAASILGDLTEYLTSLGVLDEKTAPYTPQSTERLNRTLGELVREPDFQANIPSSF